MNIIIILLIFCTVLFLYLHIYYHLKTSDDLELYEISSLSKERLEEICDLRQPIIFNYSIGNLSVFTRESIIQNYSSFDIKLRNISNYNSNNSDLTTQSVIEDSEVFLPLSFKNALKVIEEDENSKFISENNNDFLIETSLLKTLQSIDEFIRPSMMSSFVYDYLLGSKDSLTPFRYDMNYRNYFLVLEGSLKVKLCPPKSGKYLHKIKDYDNFEFRSPINPWIVQEKYRNDFDKIKCMEITLEPGKILFIPAYWWYSFKFENNKTSVISFKYRTYMNTLAMCPDIFISFLQKQNIKHNIVGTIKTE